MTHLKYEGSSGQIDTADNLDAFFKINAMTGRLMQAK